MTIIIRYSCVSVLDNTNYQQIIDKHDKMDRRSPPQDANLVLGSNVWYNFSKTIVKGGIFLHKNSMYNILEDYKSNDEHVMCKITEGNNVGQIKIFSVECVHSFVVEFTRSLCS